MRGVLICVCVPIAVEVVTEHTRTRLNWPVRQWDVNNIDIAAKQALLRLRWSKSSRRLAGTPSSLVPIVLPLGPSLAFAHHQDIPSEAAVRFGGANVLHPECCRNVLQ